MKIKTASFVVSNTDHKKCPDDGKPEFAFIGRSNVGKSSLINLVTGTKKLAKTSSTPGKTQLINHFVINDEWYLVDLPGYGYAKASKSARFSWEKFIADYLTKRKSLMNIFILLDARLDPQKIDLEFINWCGENQLPFVLVFTKIDKLSKSALQKNLLKFNSEMLQTWEELPPIYTSSSTLGFGDEPLLNYIEQILVMNRDLF